LLILDPYEGALFKIMNTAWRGQFQAKKIKRKNRFGRSNYRLVAIPDVVKQAVEQWRAGVKNTDPGALPMTARAELVKEDGTGSIQRR